MANPDAFNPDNNGNGSSRPNDEVGNFMPSVTTNGNGQEEEQPIEMVEKILNQISMHSRLLMQASDTDEGIKPGRNARIVKNRNKNKRPVMPKSISKASDMGYDGESGAECDFYFIDGEIVSKKTIQGGKQPETEPIENDERSETVVEEPICLEPVVMVENECVIESDCQKRGRFVEAQIVFDENKVGIVPMIFKIKVETKEPSEKVMEESQQMEYSVPNMEQESEPVIEPDSAKSSSVSENDTSITTTATSEAGSLIVDNNSKQSQSFQQRQILKKIRCLIANFFTVHMDQESMTQMAWRIAEESSESSMPSENWLKDMADPDKIGFQNFDGENIGLYKNIGYINRNKSKFIQPSRELLRLCLQIDLIVLRKLGIQMAENEWKPVNSNELDLTIYHQTKGDSLCHQRKFIHIVLDELGVQDESIRAQQLRAKCFQYPDTEYSSDGDETMAGCITRNHSPFNNSDGGQHPSIRHHHHHQANKGKNYRTHQKQKQRRQEKAAGKRPLEPLVVEPEGTGPLPFEGQVNIRATRDPETLNDKLLNVLIRTLKHKSKNDQNEIETDLLPTGETVSVREKLESLKFMLNLDSFYITEVSFNEVEPSIQ